MSICSNSSSSSSWAVIDATESQNSVAEQQIETAKLKQQQLDRKLDLIKNMPECIRSGRPDDLLNPDCCNLKSGCPRKTWVKKNRHWFTQGKEWLYDQQYIEEQLFNEKVLLLKSQPKCCKGAWMKHDLVFDLHCCGGPTGACARRRWILDHRDEFEEGVDWVKALKDAK